MGYNTVITIRNADLPKIADDAEFGKTLYQGIACANRAVWLAQDQEGKRKSCCSLSEALGAYGMSLPDYDFDISDPVHADLDFAHMIAGGRMLSLMPGRKAEAYDDYAALASELSRFGYQVSDRESGQKWHPDVDPGDDLSSWMKGWSNDAMQGGTTSLIILNDAINQISYDQGFGQRMVDRIGELLIAEKRLFEMSSGSGDISGINLSRDLSACNHVNAASVIGSTPEGGTDLVVSGGNWGRMIRPFPSLAHLSADEVGRKRLDGFRKIDLNTISEVLLCAGFHVKAPGRSRAQSPFIWNEKNFVRRPEPVAAPEM